MHDLLFNVVFYDVSCNSVSFSTCLAKEINIAKHVLERVRYISKNGQAPHTVSMRCIFSIPNPRQWQSDEFITGYVHYFEANRNQLIFCIRSQINLEFRLSYIIRPYFQVFSLTMSHTGIKEWICSE